MRTTRRLLLVVAPVVVVAGAVLLTATGAGAAEPRTDVVCNTPEQPSTLEQLGPDQVAPADMPTSVPGFDPTFQVQSESIRAYQIDIAVQPDGSAQFTETITYDFGGRTDRHGILRQLALSQPCNDEWTRRFPIHDVSVSSPTNAPHDVSVESLGDGDVQLRIGSPDYTVYGQQVYVIRYTLDGVVNAFADHEELYWNAVGNGWPTPIYDTVVQVTTPVAATRATCYAGPYKSTSPCDAIAADGDTVTFQQQQLGANDGLSVVVALPAGSVAAPTYFERQWTLRRAFSLTPATVGGSLALMVALVGAVVALAYGVGRDRRAVGSPVDVAFATATDADQGVRVGLLDRGDSPVEFGPPDAVRPAQLAVVRYEKVRPLDVSATIVHLAVRGVLRIEEVGEGRKTDYRLVKLQDVDDQWPTYERELMRSLFDGNDSVLLSDLEQKFASKLAKVIDSVYTDAVGHGWFPRRPDKTRVAWRALGVLAVFVSGGLMTLAILFTSVALLAVPVVVAALALFFLAGRFPRRTPAGTGLRRRIGGFEAFMRDSEAPRAQWAEQRGIFSEYLPYAIVLGIADRWAATFAPLGEEAMAATGVWYVGHQPFSVDRVTAATSSFAHVANSALSSTPPSSSGSSGFSGGGFSGGGGGGGGGGSW